MCPRTTTHSSRSTSRGRTPWSPGFASVVCTSLVRSRALLSPTRGSRPGAQEAAVAFGLGPDERTRSARSSSPRGDGLCRRRGAAPDRRLRGARPARRRGRASSGRRLRRDGGPRGLLYDRYEIDDEGTILDSKIVLPTSQNEEAIEDDLRGVVEAFIDAPHEELSPRCEQTIRTPDPWHLLRDSLPLARGAAAVATRAVGVGNAWAGDDAAGLVVVRPLRAALLELDVRECEGEPIALLDACLVRMLLDRRRRRRPPDGLGPSHRCRSRPASSIALSPLDARVRRRGGDRARSRARPAARPARALRGPGRGVRRGRGTVLGR